MTEETVFIRLDSHRAADKVKRALGVAKLEWYSDLAIAGFSGHGGRFAKVTATQFEAIKNIKSVKKPRIQVGYSQCWS